MIPRLALLLLAIAASTAAPAADGPEAAAVPPNPSTTVAVARWENRNVLRDDDWLADAAAEITSGVLALQPGLVVLERQASAEIGAEAALAPLTAAGADPAGAIGAGVLVVGSFSTSGDRLEAQIRVVHGDGRGWSDRREGAADDYARLFAESAKAAARAITGGGAMVELPVAAPVPLAAAAAFWRGRRALASAEPERAVAELLRAVQRDPGFVAAWRELAHAFEGCGREAAALAALEHAVALDPDAPGVAAALYQLALACERGDPALAIGVFRTVVAKYPVSRLPREPDDDRKPGRVADLARAGIVRCAARTGDYAAIRSALPDEDSYQREAADAWSIREARATGRCPSALAPVSLRDGVALEVELHSGDGHRMVLVAPDGQTIAKLRVEVANTTVPPQLAVQRWFEEQRNLGIDLGEQKLAWTPGDRWVAEVDVGPSGWNGVVLAQDSSKDGISQVTITARTRPRRPASLRLTTAPEGAHLVLTWADGTSMRSVSPCLLVDLPPGPCTIAAMALGQIAFTGETALDLAAGETGVHWRLPLDRADGGAPDWPVCEPVPVPECSTTVTNGTLAAATRGAGSWLVTVPVGGDVWLAERSDEGRWRSGPLPSPVNTVGDEAPDALVQARDGRLVLLFRREGALLASTSDDGRAWSLPETVFLPANRHDWVLFLDAAAGPDGTVAVVVLHQGQVCWASARGGRGFGALRGTNFAPGIDVSWDSLRHGAVVPTGAGFVWHLAEPRGRRLAMSSGPWTWLPEAAPHPQGVYQSLLWSCGGTVGLTADLERSFRGTGSGWTPLGAVGARRGGPSPLVVAAAPTDGGDPQRLAVVFTAKPGIPFVLLAGPGAASLPALEITRPGGTTAAAASPAMVSTPAPATTPATVAAADPAPAPPSPDAGTPLPDAATPARGSSTPWVVGGLLVIAAGLGGAWWWMRKRAGATT